MNKQTTIAKYAVTAIFALLSFSGCEKDNSITNSNPLKKEIISTDKSGDPFEIYGELHNGLLDYVAELPNFNNVTREEIYLYSQTYENPHPSYCMDQSWSDFSNSLEYTINLGDSGINISETLLNDGLITTSDTALVNKLVYIFENAADFENQTIQSTIEFSNAINNLEDYIYTNYEVVYDESTKEGNFPAQMLAMCSIAKSSYSYWTEAATNPAHPWYTRFEQSTYDGFFVGFSDIKTNRMINKSIFTKAWHALKTAYVDTRAFFNCPGGGLVTRTLYAGASSSQV